MTSTGDFSFRLRCAYLAMHRRANARFAAHGLTADQYVVLTALAERKAGTQAELVERCQTDPNTLSGLLGRLEAAGLVTRPPVPGDARARGVELTQAGRRRQAELAAFNAPFQAELEGLFQPEERVVLYDFLNRISRAMESSTRGRARRASRSDPITTEGGER